MNDLLSAVAQISQELSLIEEKEKLLNPFSNYHLTIFKNHNAFIAGGAITSIFSNKDVADYDIFFKSEEDFEQCRDAMKDRIDFITNNAITFKTSDGVIIQLIKLNYYPNPEDIFNDFDFTINCGLYDFRSGCFKFHSNCLKHISQRKLIFNTTHRFPIASLIRSQKYKDRGYTMDQQNFFKIVMKIATLEIKTNKDAAEQLQGMYFSDGRQREYKQLLKDESPFNLNDFLEVAIKIEDKNSISISPTKPSIKSTKPIAIDDDLPF